jgi:hypothetical protein
MGGNLIKISLMEHTGEMNGPDAGFVTENRFAADKGRSLCARD